MMTISWTLMTFDAVILVTAAIAQKWPRNRRCRHGRSRRRVEGVGMEWRHGSGLANDDN